jgi:hypothetical protein
MAQNTNISERAIRLAAAQADADLRTAHKFALGQRVKGLVAERLAKAFDELGVRPLVTGRADAATNGKASLARAERGR